MNTDHSGHFTWKGIKFNVFASLFNVAVGLVLKVKMNDIIKQGAKVAKKYKSQMTRVLREQQKKYQNKSRVVKVLSNTVSLMNIVIGMGDKGWSLGYLVAVGIDSLEPRFGGKKGNNRVFY